jgi:hypothetical protein
MNRYFAGLVGAGADSPPAVRPRLSPGFHAQDTKATVVDAAPTAIESVLDVVPSAGPRKAATTPREVAPGNLGPTMTSAAEPGSSSLRAGDENSVERSAKRSSRTADVRSAADPAGGERFELLADASTEMRSSKDRSLPSSSHFTDEPTAGPYRTSRSEVPAEPVLTKARPALERLHAERVFPSPRVTGTANREPEPRPHSPAPQKASASAPHSSSAAAVATERQIHISIGRVIVTGTPPKQKLATSRPARRTALDLDRYLDKRRREEP